MNARSCDSGELARSLLADLPEADRAALMIEQFQRMNSLEAVVSARNALTDRAAELIADRFEMQGARHG